MKDYQPLKLSGLCNVGTALMPAAWRQGSQIYDELPFDTDLPLGSQTFHGLPFQIGSQKPTPERCCLGFGPAAASYQEGVTIPVWAERDLSLYGLAVPRQARA